MTSINNLNHKVTLLERKVKYGDNGGINVNGGLLSVDPSNNAVKINNGQLTFTGSNKLKDGGIFISKDTPYPSTITGPNRPRLGNMIMIGGSIDISNGVQNNDDYSTIIHGSNAGDVSGVSENSYFQCIVGYGARMNASGRPKSTVFGALATALESDGVLLGTSSKIQTSGVSIGTQSGLDISSAQGVGTNVFVGYSAGRGITTGAINIALGSSAIFSTDVSRCLNINNQRNPAIGGLYGTNLGLNTFLLGLNNNSPTSPLDISGNFVRLRNPTTPTSSADAQGNVGNIAWDDNYVYVKTATGATGWKRTGLTAF